MNKSSIQKFAVWARTELIAQVSQRAYQYGITEEGYGEADAVVVSGRALTPDEERQRRELVSEIRVKGYHQVMEEVAYTWFNRFIALRFMEVNNYLPSHIRVFSDSTGAFKPEILSDVLHLDLPGLDQSKVADLIEKNRTEDLYRYLLLTQCNALNDCLPVMFEKMGGYTELLLPNNILRQDGIIGRLVSDIEEDDWKDQVQIIGWLYQYYNSELKDETFALLKKNVKVTKERIPSATQLFTPDWIVRYMVENSLGRLWLEGHPDSGLKSEWEYYLDEAEQEASVQAQLAEIRHSYEGINPKDIKIIDPCMGSGHILVYAFDVLMQIYLSQGYSERDAAYSILKNNLYGLDIDKRAAQLAYFAVMMKARQYDRRIFSRGIMPNVFAITESNGLSEDAIYEFVKGDPKLKSDLDSIISDLHDAKEYGSILAISPVDFDRLYARLDALSDGFTLYWNDYQSHLLPLLKTAELLSMKYDVFVTNPPYMGSKQGMNAAIKNYLQKNYADSKSDLYCVFMEVAHRMVKPDGLIAMVNQHGWMFLSSFTKYREKMIHSQTILNMIHLGTRAFEDIGGEVVQTTTFVLYNRYLDYIGKYVRLTDYPDSEIKEAKALEVASGRDKTNLYTFPMSYFGYLPDTLIGYWISKRIIDIFNNEPPLSDIAKPRQGLSTSDNDRFLRFWFEPSLWNIGFGFASREDAKNSGLKWFPYNKGGEFRKWYGNNNYVINWQNDGEELRAWADYLNTHFTSMGRLVSQEFYFKNGLTWSSLASGAISLRIFDNGFIFDSKGSSMFFADSKLEKYILALINSKISMKFLELLAPTLDFNTGSLSKIPVVVNDDKISNVDTITSGCISLSRSDWDSFETSWDFKRHPLLPKKRNNNLPLGMKVSKEEWIRKLRAGSACFSPVNDFIVEGETTGNDEQGDKYEGVFARLKNGDSRIEEMKAKLGDDLEVIFDGDYTLLRRKSCKNVPVFCMYGYVMDNIDPEKSNSLGNGKYDLSISTDSEMHNGSFSDSDDAWTMLFSTGHLQSAIEKALDERGDKYRLVQVIYNVDSDDDFFVNPTDEYRELEHKLSHFSNQQELRIILPERQETEKYLVDYEPLSNRSAGILRGRPDIKANNSHGYEKGKIHISQCYEDWEKECNNRFTQLKANEEELNRIFIDIYGLQDELTPEVEDKDVTVRLADKGRDVRSLISYAVGCMFGRYSLDCDGLAYAGGEWDEGKYVTFTPDKENIIPICDDDYFDDDITGRFVKWVETVYGKETLEENLRFIAEALGGKGSPREVIRNYFLNDFYQDHLKIYQKRPIYWLFDSGKKNGFKALVYMHRYKSDLLARMRTDYVHEQQERYRTQLAHIADSMETATQAEKVRLSKQEKKLREQALEIGKFEEKIHHLADMNIEIDLDDGVKTNYQKFGDVLGKIK